MKEDWRETYDKIDAINFSKAKRLLRSGKHFRHAYGPDEDKESEHMIVGTMVHAMILQGKDLRTTYALKPLKMSFATNEGKAWKAAQLAKGLEILDSEAAARVPKIADAIASNKKARAFIKICPLREHVIVSMLNGVRCKGMLDMVGHDHRDNPGFAEIKTLPDCRRAFFIKRICTEPFHYDGQVCWYRRLLRASAPPVREEEKIGVWSIWIAAENRPPFDVAIYAPSDRMLASGEDKIRDIFTTLHGCYESNTWPGVQADNAPIEVLDPPRWRIKDMNHEYEDTY